LQKNPKIEPPHNLLTKEGEKKNIKMAGEIVHPPTPPPPIAYKPMKKLFASTLF
jgi:hypothetical protein